MISEQDKKIIQDCINNLSPAWERFIRRFSGLVMWSIKTRLVKTSYKYTDSDTEDILQEVFCCLYSENKLSQLKDLSKITGWLYVLSANKAINYMRRTKGLVAEKSISIDEKITSSPENNITIADTLHAKTLNPIQQLDLKLKKEILADIIESLQPKEKLVLNLYYLYENSIKEISLSMGLAQGSVASIISRAKDKIKLFIEEKEIK